MFKHSKERQGRAIRAGLVSKGNAIEIWKVARGKQPVCTENFLRVDDVMELPLT
jgi:hypothetical protein